MASRRETAGALADAVVELVDGDLATAVQLAEAGDHAWWRARADEARVPFMVREDLQSATVTVLRDRLAQPDPFASFPT